MNGRMTSPPHDIYADLPGAAIHQMRLKRAEPKLMSESGDHSEAKNRFEIRRASKSRFTATPPSEVPRYLEYPTRFAHHTHMARLQFLEILILLSIE